MNTRKVMIIGAGIGGLMAAAVLARKGYHVIICDKAVTVGGSAGWYVRKDRMYPTGATIAFGLEPDGMLHRLLSDVGALHKLNIKTLHHPMDVILSDRKISIFRSESDWEQQLSDIFNERAVDVVLFWRELRKISLAVEKVTATEVALPLRSLSDLGKLPSLLLQNPRMTGKLTRYVFSTVESLLIKFQLQDYAPFRSFLNAQLVDAAQTDIRHAALLPCAVALDIYRRGSFAVEGGLASVSRALAEVVIESGGQIFTSNSVKRCELLLHNRNKVWRVETSKHSFDVDAILNASGLLMRTENNRDFELLPDENVGSHDQWGAFRIDAILEGISIERELPFAWQIVPESKHSELFGDEFGPVYITFHDSLDAAGNKMAGEIMMTASVHTALERWKMNDKNEYQHLKTEFTKAILFELEKALPGARNHVKLMYSGSPLTYGKFVGKIGVGGKPLTVRNSIIFPTGSKSSHPAVFLAGEQVFPGPGTLSCALSGFYAARSIQQQFPL